MSDIDNTQLTERTAYFMQNTVNSLSQPAVFVHLFRANLPSKFFIFNFHPEIGFAHNSQLIFLLGSR